MASLIEYPVIRINPYPLIGTQFTAGLDAVVAADSTVDDVVQAVYDYVQPLYYPYPASASTVENELKAVIYKALNGFGNQMIRSAGWPGNKTSKANVFNNRQQVFVEIMLNGLSNVPVNAIDSYLSDVEDNITNSRLSLKEQAPLLVATLVGRKSYAYWMDKTTTPGDWSGYFSANRAINFANIPYWVSASVQGTLLAATRNDNADKTQNVSINPAHALASGLAVAASRVMLNYVERISGAEIDSINKTVNILNDKIVTPKPEINIGRHDRPDVCADAYYSCKKLCALEGGAYGGAIASGAVTFLIGVGVALLYASYCIDDCYCSHCTGTKRDKFCGTGAGRVNTLEAERANNFRGLHSQLKR